MQQKKCKYHTFLLSGEEVTSLLSRLELLNKYLFSGTGCPISILSSSHCKVTIAQDMPLFLINFTSWKFGSPHITCVTRSEKVSYLVAPLKLIILFNFSVCSDPNPTI